MIPVIPHDKANHALYGYVIYTVGSFAGRFVGQPVPAGLAMTAVFALGKEVYDKVSGKGTPDKMDFVATMAGAVPAALLDL